MDLNVLNYHPYRTKYYLTHPWEYIREIFENLHDARDRAKKGFCPSDIWNMDEWFKSIMPQMLRYLANNGYAYPGDEKFDTPEKWKDWLYSIADLFDAVNIDEDEDNEFAKKYYDSESSDPGYEEIKEQYFARRDEILKERQVMLISAMNALSEGIITGVLWD